MKTLGRNMQEIQDEKYNVRYQSDKGEISIQGALLLNGALAYEPLLDLLKQGTDEQATHLDIDIRELKFLNSSGINMLTKFVLYVKAKETTLQVHFQAYEHIAWQVRLLVNLKRLLPTLNSTLHTKPE
jgi:hypothetical protein